MRCKRISIILLICFTNTFLFTEFCRLWEIPGCKLEVVKRHDVAIVLGGMSEFNNDLNILSFRRQGDRLIQALSLYHRGKVKKLLVTGDSGHLTDRGLHEAKQVKKLLISWGIPEKDILTEEQSVNTYENAVMTAQLLKEQQMDQDKFILVTSGIHMRRALACFNKAGIECTPYSTDLYTGPTRTLTWEQYILPEFDNFSQWHKLMKEMVGYVSYWAAGYL